MTTTERYVNLAYKYSRQSGYGYTLAKAISMIDMMLINMFIKFYGDEANSLEENMNLNNGIQTILNKYNT